MGKRSSHKKGRRRESVEEMNRLKLFDTLPKDSWSEYGSRIAQVFILEADAVLPDEWDLITVGLTLDEQGNLGVMAGARKEGAGPFEYTFLSPEGDGLIDMVNEWVDELEAHGVGPWRMVCFELRPARVRSDGQSLTWLSPMWSEEVRLSRGVDLEEWIKKLGSFPTALHRIHDSLMDMPSMSSGLIDVDAVMKQWNGQLRDFIDDALMSTGGYESLLYEVCFEDLTEDPLVSFAAVRGLLGKAEPGQLTPEQHQILVGMARQWRSDLAQGGHMVPWGVLLFSNRSMGTRTSIILQQSDDPEAKELKPSSAEKLAYDLDGWEKKRRTL